MEPELVIIRVLFILIPLTMDTFVLALAWKEMNEDGEIVGTWKTFQAHSHYILSVFAVWCDNGVRHAQFQISSELRIAKARKARRAQALILNAERALAAEGSCRPPPPGKLSKRENARKLAALRV